MIDPCVFVGEPLVFKKICLIYPPKVKDLVANNKILQYYKLLTYAQEEIEDILTEDGKKKVSSLPTPLEFLLINCYHNEEFRNLIIEAFKIFTHEQVTFLYERKIILLGDMQKLANLTSIDDFHYLSPDNFFEFQNLVRMSMGNEPVAPYKEDENNFIKEVHRKSRRRERIAAKNRKGISFTTSLCAICCMGIGLSPLNIGEISYASVGLLMSMYQQKEKYQTDIDSLMAGADPKKVKPKYWIREQSDLQEISI